MYHIFQEEQGTQVILREAFETEEELNQAMENPTLPIIFVYDDLEDSYSNIRGYFLAECKQVIDSLKK